MRFIVWNVPARFNALGKVRPDWWEDSFVQYAYWALDAAEQGSTGSQSMDKV
jgi:predicted transcriptional regulator